MTLLMSGLDHDKASLALRERLSFTKNAAADMARELAGSRGVSGAVLLSTCNRTEVYLSCEEEPVDPGKLLCLLTGCDHGEFADAFVTREGEECVRHIMEVSCGLRSQILGEDQILTQVKDAAAIARESGAIDAVLESLFRTAASCGKAVKTELRIKGISGSAAESAVRALENALGGLENRRVLVIGNGEMGRLAASLLRERGCDVTVTLRSYRHGQTLVPAGCRVVAYDERYSAMEGVDAVISATTSPHYTVSEADFAGLANHPAVLIDLAIPRDIEPGAGRYAALYNIDDLGEHTGLDSDTGRRVGELVDEGMEKFYRWYNYRLCMPAMEELREAVLERVRWHLDPESDAAEAAEEAAGRAAELLLSGLSDCLSPEKLRDCARGIRSRTR